ncbi:hypothetical protein AL346_22770 (plasmid) [Chelatococcus sp. CO-6]|nr:hypothetical protein AL346_22770 [Chelatococcus sp. CO-6]
MDADRNGLAATRSARTLLLGAGAVGCGKDMKASADRTIIVARKQAILIAATSRTGSRAVAPC